jgi:2-polyprenyl-6-methoxyphenol hydroxylase-like FAD-dependent oxidoreductase
MSPVGGVGINLAIADAVAAARVLAGPLRAGQVSARQLARVQARRWIPAALLQALQRMIHARVIAVAVSTDVANRRPSTAVRLVSRAIVLRQLAGYVVAIGPLPEHAPQSARK